MHLELHTSWRRRLSVVELLRPGCRMLAWKRLRFNVRAELACLDSDAPV